MTKESNLNTNEIKLISDSIEEYFKELNIQETKLKQLKEINLITGNQLNSLNQEIDLINEKILKNENEIKIKKTVNIKLEKEIKEVKDTMNTRDKNLRTNLETLGDVQFKSYLENKEETLKNMKKIYGLKILNKVFKVQKEKFLENVILAHTFKKEKINEYITFMNSYNEKCEFYKKEMINLDIKFNDLIKKFESCLNFIDEKKKEKIILEEAKSDLKTKIQFILDDQIKEIQIEKQQLQLKHNINFYLEKIKEINEKINTLEEEKKKLLESFDKFTRDFNENIKTNKKKIMGNKSNFCNTYNEENEVILSNSNEKIITQIKNDMSIINNILIKNNSIGHSFIIPLSDTRDSSPSINLSPINPKKNDINQIQYIGNIIDGKKEGKGKLIYPDGTYYEGNFKNDLFNGKGIFVNNNSIYNGDFLNGKKHGKGKIEIDIIKNKNSNNNNNNNNENKIEKKIYEGDWENDFINGNGIEIIQNENGKIIYNGQFIKGKKNGKGKLILSNGSEYYGDFKNDLLEGNGIFKWNDNKYYNGEWNNNCINGFGILNEEDKKFIGYFKDDKKNGIGGFIYKESNVIVIGNWSNDKMDNGIIVVIDNEKNENIIQINNGIFVKKFTDDEINEEKIKESKIYQEFIKLYKEKIKNELN